MKKVLSFLSLIVLCACSQQMGKESKSDSWDFVLHARSASLNSHELVLSDLDQYALAFAASADKEKKMIPYKRFIQNWGKVFEQGKAPNAAVAFYNKQNQYEMVAITIQGAKLEGNQVHLEITPIDASKIPSSTNLGETALFIDGGQSGWFDNWH